jgi:hypothetical protein
MKRVIITIMMRLICSRRLKVSPFRLRQLASYTFESAVGAILRSNIMKIMSRDSSMIRAGVSR